MERNFYSKWVRRSGQFMLAFALVFFMAGISQVSAQMSGNYTIDKNGTATASNFQSFDAAIDALRGITRSDGGPSLGGGVSGAVTITVAGGSGPYTEQISIPSISGASSTNTITIDGNGEEIRFSSTTSNRYIIRLDGADYFTFKNLTVKSTSSSFAWGFHFRNSANYNIIEDCQIDLTSITSTSSSNSVGITFTGSTTTAFGYSASSSGGVKGENNIIRRNEIFGSTSNRGMYIGIAMAGNYSNRGYTHNNLVEDNIIRNFYYYGVYAYYMSGTDFIGNEIFRGQKQSYTTFYGIYAIGDNHNIIRNYIHTPYGAAGTYYNYVYGIYSNAQTYGSSVTTIANNIVNFDRVGYYYNYGIMAYYGNTNNIYHNTVYMSGGSCYYRYGIYLYDYTNSVTFNVKNNNIDLRWTSSPIFQNVSIYYYQPSGGLNSDRNNFSKLPSSSSQVGRYNNAVKTTLSDWQATVPGLDENSFDIQPSYINLAAGNFEPVELDLDGSGDPVGITEDYNGNPRSATAPDIGAFEFDIPINVSSVTFPGSVCQGDEDEVEVTIQNNSALDLSNFNVQFSINNVVQATEVYTGTILSGQSGNFTFSSKITSNNLGTYDLKANVIGKTPIASQVYDVYPSPVGSYVTQGSVFEGSFRSGDMLDPDIVAYGDQIRYDIEPPTTHTNGEFGTVWEFASLEMVTPNGTSAGAQFATTTPNPNNGTASLTPVIGQSDSTFLLRYSIRYISNGCVAPVVERQIFVAPRPVAAFASLSACDGDAVEFDNNTTLSSGTIEYIWRFGDGDSTWLINPDHVYPGPGTYNVELVAVSNYGYQDVAQATVDVIENPTAEFGSVNTCEGAPVPFTDGSIVPVGTPSYTWDFGDGSALGSGNNPSHQYSTPGVYEVTMTITSNGCSDEVTNYVTYAPRAVPSFTTNTVSCNNETVMFTNGSTLSSGTMGYSWDFDNDGNVESTEANPSYEYSGFGTFDAKLTVTTEFGCSDDHIVQITLNEGPKADFTTGPICDKSSVDFTNTSVEPGSGTTGYEWSFSDGSMFSTKDISRGFPTVGSYELSLTATNTNGCQDVLTRTISVDEMPTAQFYAEAVCEGSETVFQNATIGNNGNVQYAWDFDGDGNADNTDMNPTNAFAAGSYTVDLTVTTPSGCESQTSKTVEVHAIPTGTIMAQTASVGDGYFTITGTGPANTPYTLFYGDGGKTNGTVDGSGQINQVYQYIADGLFDVKLRLDNNGCMHESSSEALVYRTGVVKANAGSLNVYPNPSNGQFTIDLSDLNNNNLEIQIFAANGTLVSTVNPSAISGGVAQVDLSTAAAGVYLVKVVSAEGVYNARITLNK